MKIGELKAILSSINDEAKIVGVYTNHIGPNKNDYCTKVWVQSGPMTITFDIPFLKNNMQEQSLSHKPFKDIDLDRIKPAPLPVEIFPSIVL